MSKYEKIVVIPAALEEAFKTFVAKNQKGSGFGGENKENVDPKRRRKTNNGDKKTKGKPKGSKKAKKRKPLADVGQKGAGAKIKGKKAVSRAAKPKLAKPWIKL